jgi:GIY-YIG catalytic domain
MKNKLAPRFYIVYQIENKANGKLYVGITSSPYSTRKAVTKHEAFKKHPDGRWRYFTPIYEAYRKDGKHFEWSVLEEIYATRAEAGIREDYWITKLNTMYPKGMNCERGGDNGKRVYENTTRSREIDRAGITKRSWEKMTPEQRAARNRRISKGLTGIVRSDSHEAKLTKAKKSTWANYTPEQRAARTAAASAARWAKQKSANSRAA